MHLRIKLIIISILLTISYLAQAQPPVSFPYQAIIRSSDGSVFTNKAVNIRISVFFDDNDNSPVFIETHSITTTSEGVAALSIGQGTPVLSSLNDIQWGSGPMTYLKVEVDINNTNDYVLLGTSPILSAPYALYTQYNVQSILGAEGQMMTYNNNQWNASDKISSLPDGVVIEGQGAKGNIFAIQNSEGETLFSINENDILISLPEESTDNSFFDIVGILGSPQYLHITPDSTQIQFNESAASKGGFAVGGLSSAKGLLHTNYLTLKPEGLKLYFDEEAPLKDSKASKGGFAVGGLSRSKSTVEDIFVLTTDSIRMYIDDNAKASKGGFAVGGLSRAKDLLQVNYFALYPNRALIHFDEEAPLKNDRASKGGFAVGGLSRSKTTLTDMISIAPDETHFTMLPSEVKGSIGGFSIGGYINNDETFTPFFNLAQDSVLFNTESITTNDIDTEGDINIGGGIYYLSKLRIEGIEDITVNSAYASATLISTMDDILKGYGFVWDIQPNPTLERNIGKTAHTEQIEGGFGDPLTNLSSSRTYYIRAYATNNAGTAYSSNLSFNTLNESDPLPNIQLQGIDTVYNDRFTASIYAEDNGMHIMFYGLVYNKTGLPSVYHNDGIIYTEGNPVDGYHEVINTKDFDLPVEGGTTYYIRAFVTYQEDNMRRQTTIYTSETIIKTPEIAIRSIKYDYIEWFNEYPIINMDVAIHKNDYKGLQNIDSCGIYIQYKSGEGGVLLPGSVYSSFDTLYTITCTDDNFYIEYDSIFLMEARLFISEYVVNGVLQSEPVVSAPQDLNISVDVADIHPTGVKINAQLFYGNVLPPYTDHFYNYYYINATISTNPDMSDPLFTFQLGGTGNDDGFYSGDTHEDLIPGTYYYVQIDVPTMHNVFYSEIKQFVTPSSYTGTITDIDGNTYRTQYIGKYNWMIDNLATTKYANGDPIENSYMTYPPEIANNRYGYLYSDATLINHISTNSNATICPTGWRIPAQEEWEALDIYGLYNWYSLAGRYIKDPTDGLWGDDVIIIDSLINFAAVPSGRFVSGDGGTYIVNAAYYWALYGDLFYSEMGFYDAFPSFQIQAESSEIEIKVEYPGLYHSIRCIENTPVKPSIQFSIDIAGPTSAIGSVFIISTGNNINGKCGVVWGLDENITIETHLGHMQYDIIRARENMLLMEGLQSNTVYYARAYTIGDDGNIHYNSSIVSFKTTELIEGAVVDIDGNIYNAVQIGDKWWMTENLKTTKFNDGTGLNFASTSDTWVPDTPATYCWPDFEEGNKDIYGAIYNEAAIARGDLCPEGWRISSLEDWTTLPSTPYITEANTDYWHPDNPDLIWEPNNITGFTARPGGYITGNKQYEDEGYAGYWGYDNGVITLDMVQDAVNNFGQRINTTSLGNRAANNEGFSVRCIKKDR